MIGFINEDVTFADGFDGAEDFFEIALGAAVPFVAKIFEDDDWNVGFAGEATHEIRFAGADRTADEITHRDEIEFLFAPKSDVLAEMFFQCFLTLDVIELETWRKDFNEVGTFAFDELGFGASEIGVVKWLALMFLEFEEIDDAVERGAGELAAGVRKF